MLNPLVAIKASDAGFGKVLIFAPVEFMLVFGIAKLLRLPVTAETLFPGNFSIAYGNQVIEILFNSFLVVTGVTVAYCRADLLLAFH